MCLAEMMHALRRSLRWGRFVSLVSFNVHGSFDNVSRGLLMGELAQKGLDVHARRAIRNWLTMRTVQGEMTSAKGAYFSDTYGITKGLPRGGDLSPLLQLIFFDPLASKLREARERQGGRSRP